MTTSRVAQVRCGVLLALALLSTGASGRTTRTSTPPAESQIDTVIGEGVETFAVLSTQSALSTGGYKFAIHDTDGQATKIPWTIDLTEPQPLFDSRMTWSPVFSGGVGYADFTDHFTDRPLAGNESEYRTAAVAAALGPRIFLTPNFTVLPSMGLIYGYTKNDFHALDAAGEQFELAQHGHLVDWHAQTLTITPSIELRYIWQRGPWTTTFVSNYSYYQTWPVERSTSSLSFRSESGAWVNGVDVDYRTGFRLFDCPLHLGGRFSRTDLFAGLRRSLGVDDFYQIGGRVTFDTTGKLPFLSRLGLGVAYVWGNGFHGYSVGIEF